MAKMTAKQQRFCDEYLIDLNATQAAIRAGYSHKTARQAGTENLSKPAIKQYLADRMAEKDSQLIAKQDEILKYYTSVMRGESESEVVVVENIGDYKSRARVMVKHPDEKERLKAADAMAKYYGLDKKSDPDIETENDGFIEALQGEVEDVWRGE